MRAAIAVPETDVAIHAFRALDPQLPLLSAKAAAQLDNVRVWAEGRVQKRPRIDAVRDLVERLSGSMREAPADARSLFDPITETVFSSAFAQSHHGQSLKDKNELAAAAELLTKLVSRLEKNEDVTIDELVTWRDFCIALSSIAASKQQSIYDTRPTFRHRR